MIFSNRLGVFIIVILLCSISWINAQDFIAFETKTPTLEMQESLTDQFTQYQVWQLTDEALASLYTVSTGQDAVAFQIRIPGEEGLTPFQLYPDDLRSKDFRSLSYRNGKTITAPSSPIANFAGYRDNDPDHHAYFTIDANFLLASWREGKDKRVIEPLWRLYPNAPRDLYITYLSKDVVPREGACGTDHLPTTELRKYYGPIAPLNKTVGQCLIVDIALAADFRMFQAFGSVASVENFMFGVLGDVQTNYDDEFNNELVYEVLTTFVADCSSCDPWTTSTGAGTLLDDFVNWGNNGGFGTTSYDVASLWTDRDLAGSTIGVAYLGAVCFSLRYNLLQNFTTNSESLRVLWSHELGHNFDATHDASGSPTIMAPSVNTSTQWSNQSISQINSFVSSIDCLDPCSGASGPPNAEITSPESFYCVGSQIPLFDISTGSPEGWFWEMPGATPSTSSQQHPIITYDTPGSYTVTLFVDNSFGSDVATFNIEVSTIDGSVKYLSYENFEQGLGEWSSENPDGQIGWETTETDGNPGSFAAYVNNFDYNNGRGQTDALVSPIFDLTVETDIILALEYAYRRFSTSTSDVLRIYASTDGGGSFPDLLFEGRETGVGNFATGPTTNQAFFPSTADDWCGQGPGCIELDVSNYAGESEVVFRIENISDFGNNMFVDNVYISANCETPVPPVPDFLYNPEIGCAPLDVTFLDITEQQVDIREWTFPGGDPDISFDEEVIVTYTEPGLYDVSLYVENTAGSNTLTVNEAVQVLGTPNVSFTFTQDENTFTFTVDTDPEVSDIFWDFGDGNFNDDNLLTVTHTYDAPGSYVVEVEVFNGCQDNTSTQTVVITPDLTADFTATPTEGCAPLMVQFTAEGEGDGYTYEWTFPGGEPATSTIRNPEVTYNSAGSFDVTLTTSRNGETMTNTQTNFITVNDVPTTAFTATTTLGSLTVQLDNQSTNADSYLYDFGDGTTATTNPDNYTYASAGTYTITLTATNECGSTSATQEVTVIIPVTPSFTASTTAGCSPLSVSFTAAPQADGQTYEWSFPGGEPESSTEPNPTVVYNTAGVYDVSLSITNAAGTETTTQTNYITVNDVPNTAFTATTTLGSLTVELDNQSTNADSYLYDFGDGNTAADNPGSYTYASAGTYTITLTATNECGSTSATQEVTVILPVTPSFTASTTAGCSPLSVSFTAAPQTDGQTYEWSFPGGEPESSTEPNPTVVYNTAGVYNVSLSITNAAGTETTTQTNYITVNDVPNTAFTATTTLGSLTVELDNQSTNADSYLYDFGDGNTATDNPGSYTYASAGTYNITLIATNECGSTSATQEVTVILPVTPSFTASTTAGCSPLSVSFTAAPQADGQTYEWSFPGGEPESSTEPNPTVVYNTAGVYDVSLSITNAAGTETTTQTNYITVNDVPNTAFTATTTLGSLTVELDNQSTNADSYLYDFGDGNTANDNPGSYTYANAGTYTITLTATNECGSTSATQEVTVILPVTPSFTASTTAGCDPLSVSFTAAPQADGQTYEWSFPGGEPESSTDPNPTVVYNTAGVYDVSLSITNAAGTETTTETDYITVGSGPDASFSFTNEVGEAVVNFTSNSTDATSYSWNFGDGNTSNAPNPSHTYTDEGTYTVTLTTTNDCGSNTSEQQITIVFPPGVEIIVDQNEGCAPLIVLYRANPNRDDYTYSWDFPGGEPATATTPSVMVTYATAGSYNATLTATNAAGSVSTSLSTPIVVLAAPTANFTTDYTVGELTATFTANATNVPDEDAAYQWNFGDGQTGTGQTIAHTYTEAGTYTVTLTVTGICGSFTTEEELTIITPPQGGFTADTTMGCAPLSVNFTPIDQGEGFVYQWSFPGGEPATSTTATPTVTYSTAGSYAVGLSVSNAAGTETIMEMDYIVVGEIPNAAFTATNDLGELEVEFTAEASTATSWAWDFGDGNTASGQTTSHTYATDGDYTARLISTNNCGSDTSFQTISLLLPPNARIEISDTIACTNEVIELHAQPNGRGYTYEWTLTGADPATSNSANVQLSYANPGTYTIELTVSNAAGSSTATTSITIIAPPIADFAFTTNGLGADFTNTSTGPANYSWNFANLGNSTETNPRFEFPGTGNYPVTLIATNDCGIDTTENTVAIEGQSPRVSFEVSNNEGCGPLEVSFTNTTVNGESWSWSFPGGEPATSNEENPTVTYNVPGRYTVTLIASNPFGNSAFSREEIVTVFAPTLADFTYEIETTTATFNDQSTGADSIEWQFPDGSTSDLANPGYTFPRNGTYNVILIATGPCNTDTISQEIIIDGPLPTVMIESNVTEGCAPLTVQFEDASTENPISWDWSFMGGQPDTSTLRNPTVVYNTAGVYDVSLTVTNAYGSSTATWMTYLTVSDIPDADSIQFTMLDSVNYIFQTDSSGVDWDYRWTMPDNSIQETAQATYTFTESGTFPIQVEISNECGSIVIMDDIDVIINTIDSPEWAQSLDLYPNPTAGDLQIRARGWPAAGRMEVLLYNNLGQRLQSQSLNLSSGSWQHSLDLNNLPAGTYQLQFLWEGRWWTAKISKI